MNEQDNVGEAWGDLRLEYRRADVPIGGHDVNRLTMESPVPAPDADVTALQRPVDQSPFLAYVDRKVGEATTRIDSQARELHSLVRAVEHLQKRAKQSINPVPDADVSAPVGARLTDAQRHWLHELFTYHRPTGDQPSRYALLCRLGWGLAATMLEQCQDSPERTLAIRRLQEAVMWANAAIAVHGGAK